MEDMTKGTLVYGLESVSARLGELKKLVEEAAVKAVRKAGEDILREAQRNAENAAMAENQAKKGIR